MSRQYDHVHVHTDHKTVHEVHTMEVASLNWSYNMTLTFQNNYTLHIEHRVAQLFLQGVPRLIDLLWNICNQQHGPHGS